MPGPSENRAHRGRLPRRRAPELAARLFAVSALLLAACIVLAVLLEAHEPGVGTPHIRPAPPALLSP
jgi:hypothetical protein